MTSYLPFVLAGVVSGTLYGLAAAGLVLTYKTTGVLNFGHGAVSAFCAYAFYELRTLHSVPWPVAVVVAVGVVAPSLGLILEIIGRRLSHVDTAGRIVATVGILVFVQGLVEQRYGLAPLVLEPFLSIHTFTIAGLHVGYDQVTTVGVSLAAIGALFVFFRRSRLGLEMRAVVDNSELLDLAGTNPTRVRQLAWVVGCMFAGLSGILLASAFGLDLFLLTVLVLHAFGAAAVGRFENLATTFGAAIGIGVAEEVIKKFVPQMPILAGLPSSLPFIVLFGVLLFSQKGRFQQVEVPRKPSIAGSLSYRRVVATLVPVVLLVAYIPALVGARLIVYTNGAIYVTLLISLALLVRLSGQVSLCQLSFAAVGATTFAHLQTAGLPWLLACVLAGLVVVPIGVLLAIPAIRLSSLYLGLATFGFAILMNQLVFRTGMMFGGLSVRYADRPHVLSLETDRGFFYLCAAVAMGAAITVLLISHSRLGRLLRAMADSPVALRAHGANASITRVLVFSVSAFLSGIAGVLLISLTGSASATGATFGFFQSLLLLVALAIAMPPGSLILAPIAAAMAQTVVPTYLRSPDTSAWQQMIFGVVALLVICVLQQERDVLGRAVARTAWRSRTSPVAARVIEGRAGRTAGELA